MQTFLNVDVARSGTNSYLVRVLFSISRIICHFFFGGFPFLLHTVLVEFGFLFEFSWGVALPLPPAPFLAAEGCDFFFFFGVVFFVWEPLPEPPLEFFDFCSFFSSVFLSLNSFCNIQYHHFDCFGAGGSFSLHCF